MGAANAEANHPHYLSGPPPPGYGWRPRMDLGKNTAAIAHLLTGSLFLKGSDSKVQFLDDRTPFRSSRNYLKLAQRLNCENTVYGAQKQKT